MATYNWGIPHVYRQTESIYVHQPAIGLVGPTEGCPEKKLRQLPSGKRLHNYGKIHHF